MRHSFPHIAIIGGGIAGVSCALRLQSRGYRTTIYESHTHLGGCAGFFRRRGFSFDVGATTLVDFSPDGVGGQFISEVGIEDLQLDLIPSYRIWLPDGEVHLPNNFAEWRQAREKAFGTSAGLRRFWRLMDSLADTFWRATRRGISLPLQSVGDALRALRCLGVKGLWGARQWNWTLLDALKHFGLADNRKLCATLAMLVEDTIHTTIDRAPLINAALGITIRGAGLYRARGGMRGLFEKLSTRYAALGGRALLGTRVESVSGSVGDFRIESSRGTHRADQVISAIPIELTNSLCSEVVGSKLNRWLVRDMPERGSAIVVFLGVPEEEVAGDCCRHHQLLHDYDAPLGLGNNMFISVSAPGDLKSAPTGQRAVMISTHCDLSDWCHISDEEYEVRKTAVGEELIRLARRTYPRLGSHPIVKEIGTPRSYERFTSRPMGAVGGFRQHLRNTNQYAIPHHIGIPGFYLAGDTTWPGLGTVATILGSSHVTALVESCTKRNKSFPASVTKSQGHEVQPANA